MMFKLGIEPTQKETEDGLHDKAYDHCVSRAESVNDEGSDDSTGHVEQAEKWLLPA